MKGFTPKNVVENAAEMKKRFLALVPGLKENLTEIMAGLDVMDENFEPSQIFEDIAKLPKDKRGAAAIEFFEKRRLI